MRKSKLQKPYYEERDGGGEEGLGLLTGEEPAVGGGGCDRLSDRCRNPFAEWVVVAGLDDGAGVAVDDGADSAVSESQYYIFH